MTKLSIKTGDTVVVISGKDKGKTGKVNSTIPSDGKIVVAGVAMVKRHQKPRGQGLPGGIIEKEAPIFASKAMVICPECKKATRIAHKFIPQEGQKPQKVRACKKCGATVDK